MSLRLVHTSDWHLGHELHGFDRRAEHDEFLNWLLDTLCAEVADVLLITGDIYDTANPPTQAQERFYRFLAAALAVMPALQIIAIGGNHDSAARIELPRPLLDAQRVRLIGALPRAGGEVDIKGLLVPVTDRDGHWSATVAAVPYLRPGDLPAATSASAGLAARYAEILAAARAHAQDRPLIVTGHLHVAGGETSELSERRIVVGGEEAVAASLFGSGLAYVALGHLHRPQAVACASPVRYAGSPFPMSVAERDYAHSIVVCDIAEDGGCDSRCVPIPRPVAFVRVPPSGAAALGEVEGALSALPETTPGVDHPFLEVAVALDGAEPDLRQRLEAALGNKPYRLTRVVRALAGTGGSLAEASADDELERLEPAHVFDELHRASFGGEASDVLRQAFEQLLVEVLAETDESVNA